MYVCMYVCMYVVGVFSSDNLLQVDTLMDTSNMFVTSADTTIKCSAFLNDAIGTATLSVQSSDYFQTTYDTAINGLIDFTSQYINGVKPPSDPVLNVTSMVGIFIVYVIVIGCVLVVYVGLSIYTRLFPQNQSNMIQINENNNDNDKESDRMRGLSESIPDEWQNAEPDEVIENDYTGDDIVNPPPPTLVATALSPFRTGGILDVGPVAGVMPDLYKGSWDVTMGLQQQTLSLFTGASLVDADNSKLEQMDGRMDGRIDGRDMPTSSSSSYYNDDRYYDSRGPPPAIPPLPPSPTMIPSPIRSPFFFTPRKNNNAPTVSSSVSIPRKNNNTPTVSSSVSMPSITASDGRGYGQSDAMPNGQLMTTPWGSPPSIQTPNQAINQRSNQPLNQPFNQASKQPPTRPPPNQPLDPAPSNQRRTDVAPNQPFSV